MTEPQNLFSSDYNEAMLLLEQLTIKHSMKELAQKIGYTARTLQAWRLGERRPNQFGLDTLRKAGKLYLDDRVLFNIQSIRKLPYCDAFTGIKRRTARKVHKRAIKRHGG